MVQAARHLMRCGFEVVYAYIESDEISLLFSYGTTVFDRKEQKFNSILAGEASVAFTEAFGTPGVFDCRLVPLPTVEVVMDYFRWRQEDSHRNALNAYVYWTLLGIGNELKKELLFDAGIDYEATPAWQRWGTGLYVETVERRGVNPRTGEEETGYRNALKVNHNLPVGNPYGEMVRGLSLPSFVRSAPGGDSQKG